MNKSKSIVDVWYVFHSNLEGSVNGSGGSVVIDQYCLDEESAKQVYENLSSLNPEFTYAIQKTTGRYVSSDTIHVDPVWDQIEVDIECILNR